MTCMKFIVLREYWTVNDSKGKRGQVVQIDFAVCCKRPGATNFHAFLSARSSSFFTDQFIFWEILRELSFKYNMQTSQQNLQN